MGTASLRFVTSALARSHDIGVRRRIVDARFLEVSVPATHVPTFEVAG